MKIFALNSNKLKMQVLLKFQTFKIDVNFFKYLLNKILSKGKIKPFGQILVLFAYMVGNLERKSQK